MFGKFSRFIVAVVLLSYSAGLQAQAPENVWEIAFEDGFEVDFAWPNWNRESKTNNYVWDDTRYRASEGASSVWCVDRSEGAFPTLNPATDNYPNNVDSWMWVRRPFDTRNCAEAELRFDVSHQLSDADYLEIKAHIGDGVWHNHIITGNHWDFKTVSYKFSDWNGANLLGQANVTIAFRFVSNASGTAKGVFIDNVRFRKYFSGRPDMAPKHVTFSPSHQPPGGLIRVDLKLDNDGTFVSEIPAPIFYYLSTDKVIDPDEDVLIGYALSDRIHPDASMDYSMHCLLPKDLPHGEYYVGVLFDPDTLTAELSRENNVGFAVSRLVVGSESTEWEVIFSEDFESGRLEDDKWMSYPGAGSGHYSFDSTTFAAYIGSYSGWCASRPHDGYPDLNPISADLPACDANYCESFLVSRALDLRNTEDVEVILNGYLMSGELQIIASPGSDFQGDMFDMRTYGWKQYVYSLADWPVHGDLTGHASVHVGVKHKNVTAGKGAFIDNFVVRKRLPPRPDLTVDPLVLPEKAYAERSMSVQATVKNIGEAASPQTHLSVYLSENETIDTAIDLFIGKREIDPLAAGETQIVVLNYDVPASMAGETRTVGTVLDSANLVDETVKANNITTDQITFLDSKWWLTVGTNPPDLGYTVMGKAETAEKSWWQQVEDAIEVSTDSLIAVNDSVRYRFTQWDNGGMRTHRITVDTNPDTVTALFVTQYRLTLSSGKDGLTGDLSGWYDAGAAIQLGAVSSIPEGDTTRYVFNGWRNGFVGSDTTGSFVLDAPATVGVDWKTQHYLSLAVSPDAGGTMRPALPGGWYDAGAVVTVEALPDTVQYYQLDGWTGDLTGSVNPETVTMNAPQSVTANFKVVIPDWRITVDTDPPDLKYYVNGGERHSMRTYTWPIGAAHRLGADSVIAINETSRFVFDRWSDGVTEQNRIISANAQPDTVFARYRREFKLSLTTLYGALSGDTTGWYPDGHRVNFAVSANAVIGNIRQIFMQWSGDHTGQNRQGSLVMNGPKTVSASVWKKQYRLNLAAQPENGGELSPKAPGAWYDVDSEVILSALPADGFLFERWSGDLASTVNPVKIVMDTVKSVTARFQLPATSWTLTIQANHTDGAFYLDGEPYESSRTFQWPIDESHAVNADSLISLGAGRRLRFLGWSDGKARSHDVRSSDGLDTLVARYQLEYEFKVSSAHDDLSGDESGWYVEIHKLNFSVDSIDTQGLMRWVFTGWAGDYTAKTTRGSLVLDGPKTVTASWKKQVRLALSITPENSGETSPALPGRWYDVGQEVILSALPNADAGYVFHSWSGDMTGHVNPVKVSMDSAIQAQAAFVIPDETWEFTVVPNPTSANYYVDSQKYDSTQTFACSTGESRIVRADSLITLAQGRRLRFLNWSNGKPAMHVVGYADNPDTLIANYQLEYLLTLSISRGTTAGNSQKWYPADATVNLSADSVVQVDHVRWQFVKWTGDFTSRNPAATLSMTGPKQVTTSWNKQVWLEIAVDPPDGGEVSPGIPGDWIDLNAEVILSAVPNRAQHYTFAGWSGDTTTIQNPVKLKMDAPKSVTATFEVSTAVDEVSIPTEYALHQNHPNPFNPSTTISYALPRAGEVTIEIFNIVGSRVRTLVRENREAGTYQVIWDGRDQNGNSVSSGTYLYMMRSGTYQKRLKALFMK